MDSIESDLEGIARQDLISLRTHFAVLSLDVVDPLLPMMGLELQNPGPLHSVARQVVRRADQILNYQDELVRAVEIRPVLEEAFRELQGSLGLEAELAIRRVVADWPDQSDTISAFLWGSALLHWTRRLSAEVSASLPAEKAEAVRQRAVRMLAELTQWLDRVMHFDVVPHSHWDEQAMADDWDPLGYVSGFVKWRQFQRFSRDLRQMLTPAEVNQFTEALRNQGKAYRHLAGPPIDP
jgi:hypothetical protein